MDIKNNKNELVKYGSEFSQLMLQKCGDFIPFGATIDMNGKIQALGGTNGDENPIHREILKILLLGR